VGGAERLMRDLALHLAQQRYHVTYLTMRHWGKTETPQLDGVHVIALTGSGRIYGRERRTLFPPVRFGLAVARYLWRHGSDFDVVHIASFPYFPVLAAGAIRRRANYDLVVTWLEIWTEAYWRRYAGRGIGTIGWFVQGLCVRLHHTAFCISQLHARRLVDVGYDGMPLVFPGLYAGPTEPTAAADVDPELVVYAGRHVAEKRIGDLVRGFALAREVVPKLRLEMYGDGPEQRRLERLVDKLGLTSAVFMHGRRPESEVADAIARAACVATASEREGYGLIIVEAAARGTPSVVVAGPENAATELVVDGVNGAIANSVLPAHLAAAIVRVVKAGPALRDTTSRWFAENAQLLRIERSLELVVRTYEASRRRRATRMLSWKASG
jgi:glycosyltransferase involved in cell wall biosynthesis